MINHLGGLSLPRKSVVRLNDRPDILTLDVYRGPKTTTTIKGRGKTGGVGVGLYIFIIFVFRRNTICLMQTVDPDQVLHVAASDQGLHCFPMFHLRYNGHYWVKVPYMSTVKILKIGTPEIITIIVLQLEQLDFTVQYCVQKMQTE